MLATRAETLEGKRCLVSAVATSLQYTVEKLIELGAKPLTVSDSDGFIHDPDGIDTEKLAYVMELKNVRRGRIREYADRFHGATFTPAIDHGSNPLWAIPADCAFPSATRTRSTAWTRGLCGQRRPAGRRGREHADHTRRRRSLPRGQAPIRPGKAANAGGVAVSGLEMTQDIEHLSWTREQVDGKLKQIMRAIHTNVRAAAEEYGRPGDYVLGANIGRIRKGS